jgi:hypothetical protein
MQNKLLGLLLVVVATNAIERNDSGELAVALAQNAAQIYMAVDNHKKSQPTQGNYLKRVSWLYKNNPCFYKLHSFREDLPYYLAAIPLKIKDLENKIIAKKTGLTSNAMLKGVITTGISALCGYSAYVIRQQRKNSIHYLWQSQELAYGYAGMCLLTALFAALAVQNFDKVIHYAKRLTERLERYKKILALLESEQTRSGEGSIDAAAIKLMKVVVEAINVAVDQAVSAADKANASIADIKTVASSTPVAEVLVV